MGKNSYTKVDIKRIVKDEDVKFIRLQFVDIFGTLKNVAITNDQLEKALDNEIVFDGSSLSGFVRMEESDMYLRPDLSTFELFPWRPHQGKVARLICDIYDVNGNPFEADPRGVLKQVLAEAKAMGYDLDLGPEFEFFLFHTDEHGHPTTTTHDKAGYFDLGPIDLGENVRRDMVLTLEEMGFEIQASHHEEAPGQHEIDFTASEALNAADNMVTFKLVVKVIAQKHGLHATFMPKPIDGINGSGMHCNLVLYDANGKNTFYDENDPDKISLTAKYFVAGLLKHAKAITAITNPTVNSYKRLVYGFEAPIHIGWSTSNASPLIRIPYVKDGNAIVELRSPDSSCNPYLAIAVILKAGLDGIASQELPPKMMTTDDLNRLILAHEAKDVLPGDLNEALKELDQDDTIKDALAGIYSSYKKAKSIEWQAYSKTVHPWEVEQYISKY